MEKPRRILGETCCGAASVKSFDKKAISIFIFQTDILNTGRVTAVTERELFLSARYSVIRSSVYELNSG